VRCSYIERGRRCVRNGTGNPPLCRACAIIVAEAAQRASTPHGQAGAAFQRVGEVAGEMLSDLFAGRPINREKVASTITDFAWQMGSNYADFHPPLEDVPIHPPGTGGQRRRPPWPFGNQAPPPPDPAAFEAQEKLERARAARIVLGFGPNEQITAQTLKARHRELVKKHHPDRGGNAKRMAEINNAVDAIEAVIG
jgi:hypothetical protein